MKPRTRSAPLVTQYLERIDRSAISEYREVIRRMVHWREGIYVLYQGDTPYYVGLASNLQSRLKSHLKDHHSKSWDTFSVYLTVGDKHLRELEALILRTVKPDGNKQKGKFRKAENLRGTFKRMVRNIHDLKLAALMGRPTYPEEVEEKLLKNARTLRASYKSKTYAAKWRRDNRIRFRGRLYDSPSAAAVAVLKRPANGWTFWHFERAPGDWVPINVLRG